jgi:HNH endonuclease
LSPETQVVINGDVAYVNLTKGYVAVIDAADVGFVSGHIWTARLSLRKDGSIRTVYAGRNDYTNGAPRLILMHRALTDAPNGVEVDHRDGNGLNNRRRGLSGNLRFASRAENARNICTPKHNTSGIKGVSWHHPSEKWRARIRAFGVLHHLGVFEKLSDAGKAYAQASAIMHGRFARHK